MRIQTQFQRFAKSTNQSWFSIAYTVLRVVIGFQFLLAGIAKIGDWSAAGYLGAATGPFAAFFQSLAGSMIVDQLNIWGLILIGIALIIGFAVRPASVFAALLMVVYYFAQFEQNIAHGLIDDHVIYALIFIVFAAGGAGHVFGLDNVARRHCSKKKRIACILFG